jgi:hypothetical protein
MSKFHSIHTTQEEINQIGELIKANFNVEPEGFGAFPDELLERLLWGANDYANDGVAAQLGYAMYELGKYAQANNLSIDAYELVNNFYDSFSE